MPFCEISEIRYRIIKGGPGKLVANASTEGVCCMSLEKSGQDVRRVTRYGVVHDFWTGFGCLAAMISSEQ